MGNVSRNESVRASPRALAAAANAVGLVSGRELDAGLVRVGPVGSRAAVRAVAVGGRTVGYAKTVDRAAPARMARERRILAALDGLDLVPRVLREVEQDRSDGESELLWTAALTGRPLTPRPGVQAAWALAELAQAFGLSLARLHTTPSPVRTAAELPWLLSGPGRRAVFGTPRPNAAQAAVLRLARTDQGLERAAREAADRWSGRCLVHTDLAARHVVVDSAVGTSVRFVDLGRSGLGDPDWDLAGALEALADMAAICGVAEGVPTDYFLRGYRRAGGPARVDPRLRGLRALDAAWWSAAGSGGLGNVPVVDRWLSRARALAGGGGPLGRAA